MNPNTDSSFDAPSALENLANEIGTFIHGWGFKNIHGRIWAHLFVSDRPLDAGALIQRLGVSKALISMSLKEMIQYKVVRIAGKSPEGTVLYDSNPDITSVILNVLESRERNVINQVKRAFERLKNEPEESFPVSSSRLQMMGEFDR